MPRWLASSVFALSLLGGVLGCERPTPTQVLVVFEADATVRALARRLHVEVTNQDGETRVWDVDLRAGEPGATTFPVTLPLVPRGGDATRTFDVLADVLDEEGAVAARQRARSGYVANELREVRVRFTAECAAELCDRGTTCRAGRCVDACVQPSPRGDPALRACPVPDGGMQRDETGCDDVHAGALFCDGFESALPGPWLRVREEGMGTLTRLGAPAFRGAFSLEARSIQSNAFVYVQNDAIGPATTDLYVRVMTYVPSGQALEGRTNLIYAGEPAPPWGGVILGIDHTTGAAFARGKTEASTVIAPQPLPVDRWVCLEAHVAMATEGAIELWVDGERTSLGPVDTQPEAALMHMNVGLAHAMGPPIRVLIDEVVADVTRIGCE